MTIKIIELSVLLALSVASDLHTYRIGNRIIMLFITAGILTNLAFSGLTGLLSSLAGILLPVLLLFWLYILGMLGAGDIKLFCAIGSIMGAGFAAWCIAWSFLTGGIAALALMLVRRNARERFRYLGNYLKACFLTGTLLKYTETSDKSGGAKFHFSPAIAAGCALQVLLTVV